MLGDCILYAVCTGCVQCLHHLAYCWNFRKLSVSFNMLKARLPTPETGPQTWKNLHCLPFFLRNKKDCGTFNCCTSIIVEFYAPHVYISTACAQPCSTTLERLRVTASRVGPLALRSPIFPDWDPLINDTTPLLDSETLAWVFWRYVQRSDVTLRDLTTRSEV